MLQPVRTKFRKAFKGRIHGNAARAVKLNYGQFGLKAVQPDRIIGKQIEAARVALTRYMKRTGKVWTRIFPNIPVSKKPTEVRMGKGKGSPEYYACRVKPGRIIFEIDGVSEEIAREALYKASAKLPIKTKFIKRGIGLPVAFLLLDFQAVPAISRCAHFISLTKCSRKQAAVTLPAVLPPIFAISAKFEFNNFL